MSENLPKFSKNQIIGSQASSIFESIMKKFCLINPIGQDQNIGIDFLGTVLEDSRPTVLNFNVQCKGTDDIAVKLNLSQEYYSYQIKVQTLNYWKQKIDTTFLVLVDVSSQCFYWVDVFENSENYNSNEHQKITIRIPTSQKIDFNTKFLPKEFTNSVLKYHANFGPKVLESVNKLKESLSVINSNDLKEVGELIQILQKSLQMVTKETLNLLYDIIKYNFDKTLSYVSVLEQMDEIVRTYYREGIYNQKLSFGADKQLTVREIDSLITKISGGIDTYTIEDMIGFAKDFEDFRKDMVYFYREMVYEDSPRSSWIEEVVQQFENEKLFSQ
ncbi:TPA: DUF4365 domain-containing protein [Streptococcus suis]